MLTASRPTATIRPFRRSATRHPVSACIRADSPRVSSRACFWTLAPGLAAIVVARAAALLPDSLFFAGPVQPGDVATFVWSESDAHRLDAV